MSIEACVEVSKGKYLLLADNVIASKAIATFCISALVLYCDFRANLISNEMLGSIHDLVEWFSVIDAHMTTNLCLLAETVTGYGWDYSATEYERYVAETNADLSGLENPENSPIQLLSQENFLRACAYDQQTWKDTILLRGVVDNLVRVFDEIHLAETSWYFLEITPAHFRALSKTLALAAETGYAQVRLNCD